MGWMLQSVRISNFKSYCGEHDIGPFLSFTCIVGPNGSGKSNIMDALSFVLGAPAAALRVKNLAECINRQATKQECSVALVFADGKRTLELARSVNSLGASTTLVDGRVAGEKAFAETLRTLNISGRISTFLVFQHEVEAVAQKKAKELTELLEHISGSSEFKQEYDARKRDLEAANEALAAASMEKRGAAAEVKQMKMHKQEAEKYDEARCRHAEERRNLALAELFYIESQLTNRKDEHSEALKSQEEAQKRMTSSEELHGMKREYAALHRSYLDDLKQNRQHGHEVRDMHATLDRINAARDHLRRKLEALIKEKDELGKAQSVRSKETARLKEQLSQQVALLEQFEKQCKKEDAEAHSRGSKLTKEQLEEYRALRREADCNSITLRQELETLNRRRESLVEGVKQCSIAEENHNAQVADMDAAVQRGRERVRDLQQRMVDLKQTATMLEDKVTQTRIELLKSEKKGKEHEERLRRMEEQLHELHFVKETNTNNAKQAEALKALRIFNGVRGRLVDLCTIPNAKYRNAVTVAMGKNLEAVIVDTTETAMSCVRYLKEQRLAVMTFLPLDSIDGKGVDDRLRLLGMGGTCVPVIDVLSFDAVLEPAVRFAVGQSLVCDTMEEARKVAYGGSTMNERHKVVTVDGTLLLKNGSIQGGLATVQARARRWDEKRYNDLRAEYEKLQSESGGASAMETSRMQAEVREASARLEFTQTRIKVLEAEVSTNEARVRSLYNEAEKKKATLEDITTRDAKYKAAMEECETGMLRLQKSIADVEAQVFASFQKKVSIPDVAEFELREAKLVKARAERRQQLQLMVHKLKSALEAEERRLGVKPLSDVEAAYNRIQKEIESCEKDYTTYKDLMAKKEKEQAATQNAVATSKAALDLLESTIRRMSATTEEDVRKLSEARKRVTMLKAMCDALRLQRQNVMRRCQMEETELSFVAAEATAISAPSNKRSRDVSVVDVPKRPIQAGDAEDPSILLYSEPFAPFGATVLSSAPSKAGGEAGRVGDGNSGTSSANGKVGAGGDSAKRSKANAELRLDFSGLSASARRAASDRVSFVEFKQRSDGIISALQREMESLAPNLKASTRFQVSENKLGSTATQLEEAREKARAAQAAFVRVKEARAQRFMDSVEKVAANVDRVYRELTLDTRGHLVHGSAYLTLDDVEEPFAGGTKYHVTPPLKRFMAMDALSGGERTMAALALLFAIHAVSPTPYFVLDEVDAALDATNVQKLGNFIRRSAQAGQVQYLVVSLKDQLYHLSDSLVGVAKDKEHNTSRSLSFDLRKYP